MDRKEKSELESCYNTIKQLEQRCALLESCTQDLEKRLEVEPLATIYCSFSLDKCTGGRG